MNNFSQLSTQMLLRRYLAVLSLLILLLVLGYVITLGQHQQVADDLQLFSLISRQHMFSQKISKEALLIQTATTPQQRQTAVLQLAETVTRWHQEHVALQKLGFDWAFSHPEIMPTFNHVDQQHHEFYQATQTLLQQIDDPSSSLQAINQTVQLILTQESTYLMKIEELVAIYQTLIEQQYNNYSWAKLGLLMLTITLLVADTLFIFRPTFQKMELVFIATTETQRQLDEMNVYLQQKITELEQAEEAYQMLVNHSIQGLTIVQDNKICLVNQRLATILGYDTPAEMLQYHNQAAYLTNLEEYQHPKLNNNSTVLHYEIGTMTADQQFKWVEQYVTTIQYYGQPAVQIATIDITSRKETEIKIKEQEQFLRHLTDSLPGIIGYWTTELHCTFANKAYLDWFGRTTEQMIGISIQELMGETLFRKNEPYIRGALRGEQQNFERTIIKADGTTGYTWTQYIPDWAGEELQGFFALVTDITTIKQTQEALRVSELKLRTMFELLPVGISILNKNYQLIEVNPALEKILGLSMPGLLRGDYKQRRYIHPDGSPFQPDEFPSRRVTLEQQPIYEVEIGVIKENQDIIWTLVSATPLAVADLGAVLVTQDITARKELDAALRAANEELNYLANVDGLTQIANRRYFDRYLQEQWQQLLTLKAPLSLIMVDVDHFKLYNDSYGHLMGDTVLRQVAQIMRHSMGQSYDLVARYGGEEFVIILPKVDETGAISIANKIRENVARQQIPHQSSPTAPYITISLGISSLIPTPTLTPENLTTTADTALYQAKHHGRNRVCSQLYCAMP